MKKPLYILIPAALLVCAALAESDLTNRFLPVVARFQIEGVHHTERIDLAAVSSSPQWDPNGPLPIRLAEVEKVARRELRKLVPDQSSWNVDYFTVKRSNAKATRNWYFQVGFIGPNNSKTNFNTATVFVDFKGRPGIFDAPNE